jgi:hypothetical protein
MSKWRWLFISQCIVACALIIVLLISILGVPWVQAWSSDPNENTAVCTSSGAQRDFDVISYGSGGAIITWEDERSGPSSDIYAQRLDPSGTPYWTNNGIAVCTASDDQFGPTMVSDGSGGIIIAWDDWRSHSNFDIYAQRVNTWGIPQWTADGVPVCTTSDIQEDHVMVSDGSGGAIIVWEDLRSGSWDIYAQRVNASGIPQWTANGVAICTAPDYQGYLAIVSDGSGGAIITWEDYRSGSDIYAQRVNHSGVPQWTANGVLICTAAGAQEDAVLVSDGSGGAIITWEDFRGTDWDIYAQRVNPSGVPQWTANGVALCAASDDQAYLAAVSDGSGGAIIAWEDYRNGSDEDIYAQRVNQSGVPQWTANGVAVCTASGGQEYLAIESDGSGGAIIAWEDQRSGWDIYAQRMNPSGIPQWTADGIAVCTAPGEQWYPTPVSDDSSGAIIIWRDERSGSWDIYAQRVIADGSLNGVVPTITPSPTPTLPPSGAHTWSFCTAGFFPQHMPDTYTGEVVLDDLNPSAIPPEVQGVYWYDCSISDWKFWAPGVPGTTLTTLGSGYTYDYMVSVTGDCDWEIPLP